MAFVTTPISKNKVRIECNTLAANGTAQTLDLASDADTLPLIGGALPATGASTAQCRTHLRFNVETVEAVGGGEAIFSHVVTLLNVGGVPSIRFSLTKNVGAAVGRIIGTLERIQSPEL